MVLSLLLRSSLGQFRQVNGCLLLTSLVSRQHCFSVREDSSVLFRVYPRDERIKTAHRVRLDEVVVEGLFI
jgi:hypothetical protein